MPLRSWVKRLERRSKGHLASFILMDGTRYFYDPLTAQADFIVYHWELLRGEEPEVPEVYRRLPEAADIPAALEQLRPEHLGARSDLQPITIEGLFDIDHLTRHRELVVRPEALERAEDLSERS